MARALLIPVIIALPLLAASPAWAAKRAGPSAEVARLTAENDKLKAQLTAAQAEAAKYKDGYTKIVDGTQQIRGERDQFRTQAAFATQALTSCEDKNVKLVKIGREIIAAYSNVGFREVIVTKEPVTGLKRLDLERQAQDYGDRVYEAKFDRRTVKAAPAKAADAKPADAPAPAATAAPAPVPK